MTRCIQQVATMLKGRTAKLVLAAAATVGALGFSAPAAQAGDHVNIDIRIGGRFDPPRRGPVYEERTVRVWVEPVYRTVCDRVWVEATYRTVSQRIWREPVMRTEYPRVWVPDRYEERTVTRWDGRRRVECRERFLVEPAHYATVDRQVVIAPGCWETVERQELVAPAHWENVERQELVAPGHYEYRTERVETRPFGWEERPRARWDFPVFRH